MDVRRWRRRGAVLLAGLAVAVAGAVAGPAAVARADNPLPQYSSPLEGADPVKSGCSRDAYTVDSAPIIGYTLGYYSGKMEPVQLGTLRLRFSPHCQTNWAQAVLSGPNNPTYAQPTRQPVASSTVPASVRIEGGVDHRYYFFTWRPNPTQYAGTIYTDMVYSPTMPRNGVNDPPDCAQASFGQIWGGGSNPGDLSQFEQFGSLPNGPNAITGCY